MNEYERIAVEEILRYNQDGMFFFYQKKFLKAAFATGLPFAHERARYLKELYNRWQRELKREKRETQKLRNEASKIDKRSGKTRKIEKKLKKAYSYAWEMQSFFIVLALPEERHILRAETNAVRRAVENKVVCLEKRLHM